MIAQRDTESVAGDIGALSLVTGSTIVCSTGNQDAQLEQV